MANCKILEHFLDFTMLGLCVCDLAILFLHLVATVARLAGPGGARSVVAESLLVKHQLLILNRSRSAVHPVSSSLIAWSPACVRSSCARAD